MSSNASERLVEQLGPLLGAGRIGLGLVVVDDRLLELGLHQRVADPLALGLAGVVGGDELGVGGELGVEPLEGPVVGVAGVLVIAPGPGELVLLLGRRPGVAGEVDLGQPALVEQVGQVDEGLGGLGEVGVRLDERLDLDLGLVELLLAGVGVVGVGRRLDQGPAFLEVDRLLQVGRGVGRLAELVEVFEGQVVIAPLAEALDEVGGESGVVGRPGRPRARPAGRPAPGPGRRSVGA